MSLFGNGVLQNKTNNNNSNNSKEFNFVLKTESIEKGAGVSHDFLSSRFPGQLSSMRGHTCVKWSIAKYARNNVRFTKYRVVSFNVTYFHDFN